MAVTNYYTVNNEIIGEHTVGQSRLDYLTDGLGSVIATVDQTLTTKSTARYKPYGADLATTGTQASFGWVGASGYRRTGRAHSDIYVSKRHDASVEGRWTTPDPLWPDESPYSYVNAWPTTWIDPSGQQPGSMSGCPEPVMPCTEPAALASGASTIPVRPIDPCNACASAIIAEWWSQPAHKKNSFFAHCMACCVLTRLAGSDCADSKQNTQNSFDVWRKGEIPFFDKRQTQRKQNREAKCGDGVIIANTMSSSTDSFTGCTSGCLKLYKIATVPPFTGLPPMCDPRNYDRKTGRWCPRTT